MKEIQYKTFSWRMHKKNWQIKRPNVCQFELTFKCGLRCKHCYTDCYNNDGEELNTGEVKFILDKVFNAGVIWVCFTGGDPLTRQDFPEIYAYAKNKGFIVTVFTNAYSMTKEIAGYFKKEPPFVLEMTLNAVTEDLYEKISQVKGSFKKVMAGIDLILKAKIPLKIKTQITKDNFSESHRIKEFIEGLGLEFRPGYDLYARLNGDLTPCNLRVSAQELLNLDGKRDLVNGECESLRAPAASLCEAKRRGRSNRDFEIASSSFDNLRTPRNDSMAVAPLFRCAIGGGDGVNIDPYGNMFSCALLRKPAFNLLETEIDAGRDKLLSLVRGKTFATNSKCKTCNLREDCRSCPGRAFVETGDMEAPIPYYCQLAYGTA